jgi:hypothetical protein
MSNLMIARRLLLAAKNAEDRRRGKQVEEKSTLDFPISTWLNCTKKCRS